MLPTGTVTFLMTDIEGSTRAWLRETDAMPAAVSRHYAILEEAIAAHGGVRPVEQGEGDSVVGAFSRASDAVAATVAAQQLLGAEPWPDGIALAVRMAIHTGEAQLRDQGNYFGLPLIRCARLRACGHGGQVLISDVTASLVSDRLPDGSALIDLGLHRLKDLGRPERVWQMTHPELRSQFPPLLSLNAFRHNLPVQLSPLIGRRREIAEVIGLVEGERLVTLTGAGGVGKTRLALAVGAEVVGVFPGGVWFVELAAANGPHVVGGATLKVLGTTETPGASPADVAAVELGDQERSLLILDNCEHLVEECADFVSTVLQRNPAVTVVATSREQLGVTGEISWRVPSLSAPSPTDERPVVEALSQYDAVSLFVDRARRARPSFAVDDINAPAIAQICHRLDGIPLAVELAAARCRHMNAEQIAVELDDRFHLLTGGPRVLLPRQQTLAASVDWSYDLLDEVERRVLRRVGVFAGAFSLDAAEAIASKNGDLNSIEVFDTISRLVDKSLVVADDFETARYRLLETIRAFALNKAHDAGELAGLRTAHAAWWSERMDALRVTGPTDDVIAMVDANHDDLVAALSWAARDDVELGLRLLRPLARAFNGTGRAGDAMAACDELLAPDVERRYPALWLRAALSATIPISSYRGPEAFVALVTRCASRAVEMNDDYRLAVCRWLLGMSVDTDRVLVRAAELEHEPYVLAVATVRLALDSALDEPSSARDALHAAGAIASSYNSQYVRDYALAARGAQAIVFGELSVGLDAGRRLIDSPTRAMQAHGISHLARAGLLCRDETAVAAAVDAGKRAAARQVPGATDDIGLATHVLDLLRGDVVDDRPELRIDDPWLAARDSIDRGDIATARLAIASLLAGGATRQAMGHALGGLVDESEDEWHEALRLADEHELRPIAVDALEALGAAAAAGDSFVEAIRLFAAGQALRSETGYEWRWPGEQRTYDDALRVARDGLGDAADQAWLEGLVLGWHDAVAYVRRARGERGRPSHGWASLTPTEQRVVELVAEGLTNPEIAERLLMARGTVKTHLEHVFAKTGYRNRAELAAAAAKRQ